MIIHPPIAIAFGHRLCTIAFDNFIVVSAVHLMTNGWLPKRLQRRLRIAQTTYTTGKTGSAMVNNNKVASAEDQSKTNERERSRNEPKWDGIAAYQMYD